MGDRHWEDIPPWYVTKPTRSTQPCVPLESLNRVPALIGWVNAGMSPLPGGKYLLYFAFRMPCSSVTSMQWLLRLLVGVAASGCQQSVWLDTCAASRCSIVCGCWPQWLQVGVFLFPHLCRVCVILQWPLLSWFSKTHSPRDSAGFLSPGRGTEGSSMRYALLTADCCHWFVHSSSNVVT